MITESKAKSYTLAATRPSQLKELEFNQQCSVCGGDLPNGCPVLRHDKHGNLICVTCSVEIATYVVFKK